MNNRFFEKNCVSDMNVERVIFTINDYYIQKLTKIPEQVVLRKK